MKSSQEYDNKVEVDLWQALIAGQRHAFNTIFHRYVYLLYHYGNKITADNMVVEDCVQDLFIELWEKRCNLGATTSIKYYLFASLRRKIIRRLSIEKHFSELQQALFFERSPETAIINGEITGEQEQKLLNALNSLTKRQKEAIYLKFYSGLSYEEIAQVMGLNKRTVYNLISQAISALQNQFSKGYSLASNMSLILMLIKAILFNI